MNQVAIGLVLASIGLVGYAYFGYPLLLVLAGGRRSRPGPGGDEGKPWPMVTITVPAYNEAATIGATIERLLDIDYPADKLQILVVSDCSSDGTDDIVKCYAARGVELLRTAVRGGKTAAENAARPNLRGEIIVNTDATIAIKRDALRPLVRALRDPAVGVASGRDVSVSRAAEETNVGESGYVGYEMWVRRLETNVDGIVGASGCFYAIRAHLHMTLVPEALSRDFAAAMIARENGLRAVSVDEAVCFVPRTSKLRSEYRRKVRTITRGIETLFYKRHLMNPLKHPVFSWMLISHKVTRWLVPWAIALGLVAIAMLSVSYGWARLLLAAALVVLAMAAIGWMWPEHRPIPKLISVAAFAVAGNVAALVAGIKAARGELNPIWEPTRRDSAAGGGVNAAR